MPGPDGGTLTFDAAMLDRDAEAPDATAGATIDSGRPDTGVADAGVMDVGGPPISTPTVCPTAAYTVSGILTNLDGVDINASGTFTLRSLSILEVTSGTGIFLVGEVYNGGTSTRCIPSAAASIDGWSAYPVIEGPAYVTSGSG